MYRMINRFVEILTMYQNKNVNVGTSVNVGGGLWERRANKNQINGSSKKFHKFSVVS